MKIVTAVTAGYLAAASIAAAVTRNLEFVYYLVLVAALAMFVAYVHRRLRLPTSLLAGLSLLGAMHMAGGLVPIPESWPMSGEKRVVYSLWLIPGYFRYDHLVHGLGYGLTTWLLWRYLVGLTDVQRPTFGRMLLCALAAMGVGAANEVAEMLAKLTVGDTNVGGYWNTAWDLAANGGGAVLAAAAIYARGGRRRGESSAGGGGEHQP